LVFVTIPERGESAIILFSFEIGHTWQADRVIMEPSRPSDVEPCIREFIVRQRVIGEPPDLIQNTRAARAEIGQLTGDIASALTDPVATPCTSAVRAFRQPAAEQPNFGKVCAQKHR
jgi:hypothetical protein